jgi:CRP-like cAMP-binding protein
VGFDLLVERLTSDPALARHLQRRVLAKGEVVFRQGDQSREVYVLQSGLVKLFYVTHDGKEWIKSFIADVGVFGSRRSQMTGETSAFSATSLELSEVLVLGYDRFRAALAQDAGLLGFFLEMSEAMALKKEVREHDLLCLSAEARYRRFMAEQGDLAERLLLVDVARYLGVTPVALSRIRRR